MCSIARGMMPGLSEWMPSSVNVLPDPEVPYVITVSASSFSMASCTHVRYTTACDVCSGKMLWKRKCFSGTLA